MALSNDQKLLTTTHYWLAVKFIPRLAIPKKLMLVEKFGLAALFDINTDLSNSGLNKPQLAAIQHPDWKKINNIIDDSTRCHSHIIHYDSPEYPKLLKEIYDPPLIFFARGNLELLSQHQIAIVGSRNASASGREIAQNLAGQLAKHFVVTSGLALGIDAYAHQGTLQVGGFTIAVVATGLDITYPARHKKLQKDILQNNGLIISEFLPGVTPKPGHFPKRNRLISGLSLGVLVVEASLKSGSLITARCALEQGREVFAVPSSIFNQQAKGCHWLIKQGAKLVEETADILEELVFLDSDSLHLEQIQESQLIVNNENDKKRLNKHLCVDELLASVGFEITPVDKVVSRSKLPIEEVLTRLTLLELSGLVAAVPGGYLRL